MTPRENFITALKGGQPVGRVPHFELVFFLTMEAFGRLHPSQRHFGQWGQMSETERQLHRRDIADVYVQTARHYQHSAIFVHGGPGGGDDEQLWVIDEIRALSGEEFFIMAHGDATYGLPGGGAMEDFCCWLAEKPGEAKDCAAQKVEDALKRGERYRQHGGLDGWALCSDYCFNTGPFLSPAWFDEFVAPYLKELVTGYRQQGWYVIKHTDGNIMPILDALVSARPHALHSLDPQGGVDIAQLKHDIGKQVCLIGNVNCGLLDTGTEAEVIASAEYALKHGMPGGGYIFSTSNCVYTGMRLERYELIHRIWREQGNYAE